MQRFVLQENVRRFRARLAESLNPEDQRRVRDILAAAERELALMDAAGQGVIDQLVQSAPPDPATRAEMIAGFRRDYADSPKLCALIDPAPGLVYIEVNTSYHLSTGIPEGQMVGHSLFSLFPENPDDPDADGVHSFYTSLRKIAETGRPDTMDLLRYDVQDADGAYRPRYWLPVNTPLHDEAGNLVLLQIVVAEADADGAVLTPAQKTDA